MLHILSNPGKKFRDNSIYKKIKKGIVMST